MTETRKDQPDCFFMYYDDSHTPYYYHPQTGESSYNAPKKGKIFDPITRFLLEEITDNDNNNNNNEINDDDSDQRTNTSPPLKSQQSYPNSHENAFLDLNRFVLIKKIDQDIFTKVYQVRDKFSGNLFAAKFLQNGTYDETKYPNKLSLIHHEINLLSLFDHPSLLKLIGFSQTDFQGELCPTIITEYAINGSLRNILDLERKSESLIEWDSTKKLINIYGIASGMSYLHSHNFIHRDLKPENILIDELLHPKICNFEIPNLVDHLKFDPFTHSQSGFVGSPIYTAPEILIDGKYSKSSDVYAFALVIYEIITLEKPFESEKMFEILLNVATKKMRPEISGDIPPAYRDLIERCWSQQPENRPTFDDIVNELRHNQEYITDLVNEVEFLDYVDFIDSQIAFDAPKIISFDEKSPSTSEKELEAASTSQNQEVFDAYKVNFNELFFDTSDYELSDKKVGNDSSSNVYIAKNRKSGIQYAAKIKKNGLVTSKEQKKFTKKSILLSGLVHPAIAKLQGINFHPFYDVMILSPTVLSEYFKNGSLRSIIDQSNDQKFNATKKIICLIGISHAMKYSHKHKLVHCNLKPENVFLDDNLYPKIGDFCLSMGGVTFCTAPEIFKDEEAATNGSDVYSFAMIAFEVMTGIKPFSKSGKPLNGSQLEKKVIDGERPEFNNSVTDSMKELICQCWSGDPEKRPSFDRIYKKLSSEFKSFSKEKVDDKEVNSYIETLTNSKHKKSAEKRHRSSKKKTDKDDTKPSEKVDTEPSGKVEEKPSEKVDTEPSEKVNSEEENYFFGPEEEANFEVVAKIGEGMTSVVYKLVDKRTMVPLCKKVLKVEGASFKDLQNAMKEFEVLHRLHHPCICSAIAINTSEVLSEEEEVTTVALFIEFIDFTLKDCLSKNMLNSTLKTRIIVELSHALRYLHSKNMIYRDLKVSNIMLNSVYQVKLIDFGLVRINECLFGEEMMNTISMTKGIGDSLFMSPEMMREEEYDNKTDVFSFGIVLYLE